MKILSNVSRWICIIIIISDDMCLLLKMLLILKTLVKNHEKALGLDSRRPVQQKH